MNPLGIAVVGLGWWGRVIVPLAKTSAKLRVVAAADPDPAAAEFAAREQVPLSRSYEEVLRNPQVQGLVLCTPHTLHTDQIVSAAKAKKHVFCEKPLPPLFLLQSYFNPSLSGWTSGALGLGVEAQERESRPLVPTLICWASWTPNEE